MREPVGTGPENRSIPPCLRETTGTRRKTCSPPATADPSHKVSAVTTTRSAAPVLETAAGVTTGRGMTEDEIRQVVESLADAVKLLAGASAADRWGRSPETPQG